MSTRAVVFAYSNVGDRCLRVLVAGGVDVPLVVTHRDRPDEHRWFERVADTASDLGVPRVFVEDLGQDELATLVSQASPDFIFSFYFRAMLPASILALASRGVFNMHGSLLPRFRGRAPTNWAVLKGETLTGATLHEMVSRPDAGPIVDQCAVPILPDDTGRQVFDKVTVAAETVMWRSLPGLIDGTAPRRANDIENGSYFGGRTPEDGRIDWRQPAARVYDLIRAVAPPYPGAFTDLAGHRLVIAEARLSSSPSTHERNSAARPAHSAPLGLVAIGEHMLGICGDGRAIDVRRLLSGGFVMDAHALRLLITGNEISREPKQ